MVQAIKLNRSRWLIFLKAECPCGAYARRLGEPDHTSGLNSVPLSRAGRSAMLESNMLAAALRRATATLRPALLASLLLAVLVGACDSHSGKQAAVDQAPAQPVLVSIVEYQSITPANCSSG